MGCNVNIVICQTKKNFDYLAFPCGGKDIGSAAGYMQHNG
jgi:hypothetical protein